MSDTMEEGNIVGWLKKVGDQVEPGDVLAEVETDKATMELESYHEGYLLYIGIKEGPVPVDGLLAVIGEKDEDYKAALEAAQSATPAAKESEPTQDEANIKEAITASPTPAATSTNTQVSVPATDSKIKASPLAKSIAAEKGIPLSAVQGSGDNGRIIKRDVENYTGASAPVAGASAPLASAQLSPDVQYGEAPISQMRKTIARRLAESKFTSPHFYLTIEINMDATIAARKAINEDPNVKVSYNDIVVKAAAAALRKHPNINASWLGDKIAIHQDVNIGVAVAVPDGLVVPVIKNADVKPMTMINAEVKALAAKARDKKIQPSEMQGNTFTISNLGMFGIEEFTAIINPPDACILAVGSIVQKPIVKNGELAVGNLMKVTLSCDHRIVDGASGAQFLQTLRSFIENPVRILV